MSDRSPALVTEVGVVMPLEERTRRIYEHMDRAADAVGHELLAAREEHPGGFTRWVNESLPFGLDTAERIMAVARCSHLTDPAIREALPDSYSALYQLQRAPVERLRAGVANGAVHSDMTVKEAQAWASENTNGHRPPVKVPEPTESPLRQGPKVAAEALVEALVRYQPSDLSDQTRRMLSRWLA